MTDPKDQLQIGEHVIYEPEGVYATVEGYQWVVPLGDNPRIVGYKLSCDITASRSMLRRRDGKSES